MNPINTLSAGQAIRKPFVVVLVVVLVLLVWVRDGGEVGQIAVLAISTFISEDLTCIAAGQLIRNGNMNAFVGVVGCFLGIFVGDFGLWLVGRLVVRRIITWPQLVRLVNSAAAPLKGHVGVIAFVARFIPGARLPTYLAMGATGVSAIEFGIWTFLAAAIWTPLIVLLVANIGNTVVQPLEAYLGASSLLVIAAILVGVTVIRIGTMMLTESGRYRLLASIARLWRWEFWPAWVFYIPLLPWLSWLSLRHRGFMTITAANPGIPHGGFVGESKYRILKSIESEHVSPTVLIRSADVESQIAKLDRVMIEQRWDFPIILKPDAGQRGAGVSLIHTRDQASQYLHQNTSDVLVQPYHHGPYEAGIFYYRIPGESTGHIFSITDKRFSELVGDGQSIVQQLIWRHPRYRMQAGLFLARHVAEAHRILVAGERFRLTIAGNHCQGTMFCDGAHLLTPQLQQKIDQIAQTFEGFYFGRFDVRYSDVDRFRAGEDLIIIELNGVTSESTNLYDPTWSLFRAYCTLFKQWSILFQIGAANRQRGQRPSMWPQFLSDLIGFYRNQALDS